MNIKQPIISVCLELSNNCFVGCPYCLLEEKTCDSSKEQIMRIIDTLFLYNVKRYSIGGGEPLSLPYVYDIGEYIIEHGGISLLRTSATVPIDLEKVKSSFNVIDISLDSSDINVLKKCKPNADANVVFDNLKKLMTTDIKVRCNILITNYNYQSVLPTIHFLHSHSIEHIRLQKLVPRGKAKDSFVQLNVSDEIYNEILSEASILCLKLGIALEELKTVSSKTLCIIKPNGDLYMGNPKGIEKYGSVFNESDVNSLGAKIIENQKKYYLDCLRYE